MQFLIVACALLGVALGQYTGYQGYPGYQGYQGYQGYKGYPGYQGYQGYQGYPGYQGYNGYQGFKGFPGFPSAVKPVDAAAVKDAPAVSPALPAPVVPAAVKYSGPYAGIRSQLQENAADGSYSWSYETENGIAASESGSPKIGPNGPEEVVVGQYAYTAPDGTPILVRYTADANGFHPETIHVAGYHGYYGEGRTLPLDVPVPVAKPAEEPEEKSVPEKKEE